MKPYQKPELTVITFGSVQILTFSKRDLEMKMIWDTPQQMPDGYAQ